KEVLKDLARQIEERITQTEKDAVALALEISKKIIDTTVEVNPEYLVHIVREALGQAGAAAIRKIRVSPQDYEFIEVVGLRRQFESEGSWDFEADETIRSGCIVETSGGEIDFQLDRAWEA